MKKCPYCAEEIQDEAIVCRYCGKDLVDKRTRKPRAHDYDRSKDSFNLSNPSVIVLLIITIICIIIGIAVFIAGANGNFLSENRVGSPSVGEDGRLYLEGGKNVFVAVDKKSFDAYADAALNNDNYGINELINQGRLFYVPNGTHIKVLDSTITTRKVRILDGVWTGASGWVPVEWVRP